LVKKETAEGRKASKASKKIPNPAHSSMSGSTTARGHVIATASQGSTGI